MRNDMVVAGEQKALQIRLRHEHCRGEYQTGEAFAEESTASERGSEGSKGTRGAAAPVPLAAFFCLLFLAAQKK